MFHHEAPHTHGCYATHLLDRASRTSSERRRNFAAEERKASSLRRCAVLQRQSSFPLDPPRLGAVPLERSRRRTSDRICKQQSPSRWIKSSTLEPRYITRVRL